MLRHGTLFYASYLSCKMNSKENISLGRCSDPLDILTGKKFNTLFLCDIFSFIATFYQGRGPDGLVLLFNLDFFVIL